MWQFTGKSMAFVLTLWFFFSIGNPRIKQYHVLNDRCHILTKDTDDNVALWNVVTVSQECMESTKCISDWLWIKIKSNLFSNANNCVSENMSDCIFYLVRIIEISEIPS